MNRIVIVTGVSRGFGLIIAKEFAKSDWHVIGTGRSERPKSLTDKVEYHQFDASDNAKCKAFWDKLHLEHADAQICLINNAGSYASGSLIDTPAEEYAAQISSVYFTAVYMTKGLVSTFSNARIINVISTSALSADIDHTAYGSAKAAEKYFFQVLQKEYPSAQYQITNLYPSYIAPSSNEKAIDPAELAAFIRNQAETDKSYYIHDVTLYPR